MSTQRKRLLYVYQPVWYTESEDEDRLLAVNLGYYGSKKEERKNRILIFDRKENKSIFKDVEPSQLSRVKNERNTILYSSMCNYKTFPTTSMAENWNKNKSSITLKLYEELKHLIV